MRDERRASRMREIEAKAYILFAEQGFDGTSMLAIAKRAKASNETLYRWYGDKNGLFESMVRSNANRVRDRLDQASSSGTSPLDTLVDVSEVLLEMLLSDEAILLNRAAASDPTGHLGGLLSQAGRQEVLPLVGRLLKDLLDTDVIGAPEGAELGPLFIRLLVGDQQIRRVIGALPPPSAEDVKRQAALAVAQLQKLCPPGA